MKTKSLKDVLIHELQDLYSAETQLTKALPKMAKAATNERLTAAFEKHLEQTEEHRLRLERALEELGSTTRGKKCKAMEGLIAEGAETIEENTAGEALDVMLIIAAQKVEHYEISGYGSVITLAQLLNKNEVAETLRSTINEEKETDELLTKLAEGEVNKEAATVGAAS